MTDSLNGKSLFIDFDSTFVKVETIDEIARLTLQADPDRNKKIELISGITNQAMSGEIDFPTALERRLQALLITQDTIAEVTNKIESLVSDSFREHRELIKENASSIWIISGGFTEVITPIVGKFGINDSHVLANTFTFDGERVSGCDQQNHLFQDRGKIKAINSVETLRPRVMIGDGYTDLEVYLEGAADQFICYTENVSRQKVLEKSQYSANSFNQILDILHQI
mgnify:CR=1 FL=1